MDNLERAMKFVSNNTTDAVDFDFEVDTSDCSIEDISISGSSYGLEVNHVTMSDDGYVTNVDGHIMADGEELAVAISELLDNNTEQEYMDYDRIVDEMMMVLKDCVILTTVDGKVCNVPVGSVAAKFRTKLETKGE